MTLPRLIFFFVFCFLAFNSLGQTATVSGRILNQENTVVEDVLILYPGGQDFSNQDGTYQITIQAQKEVVILFTKFGFKNDTLKVNLQPGSTYSYQPVLELEETILKDIEVTADQDRLNTKVDIKIKDIEFQTGPNNTVEGIIKSLPGVVSGNELSTQYNVRGGNFDENLVYVNGIEIYRPFLVRAGQQEGLSFVNRDMVEDILFSAGGFSAVYGDKMSSVLDIKYRIPTEFGAQITASLLGADITVEGINKNKKLSGIGSFRYKTNQLLLGSLDTEADFVPRFYDGQVFLNYDFSKKWSTSFLGNLSRNKYFVTPSTRTTKFGTFQEALQLTVFFDGQENYEYDTKFGAISTTYQPNALVNLKFIASAFQTTEQEYFDVIGYYELGELNNSLGSDDFGEVAAVRGVGGFQDYARNRLDAIIANVEHKGIWASDEQSLSWGIKFQHEDIIDRYKEWERIDSAGYSVPHSPTQIDSIRNDTSIFFTPTGGLELWEHTDAANAIQSNRVMAYLNGTQNWEFGEHLLRAEAGIRSHYWTYNNRIVVSPRVGFYFIPDWKRNWSFRAAGGFYHQPPFYREMRDREGNLNKDIKAQYSIHYVAGADYIFEMWDRPFKIVSEVYFKDYRNLIPYDIENVRIRYTAENNARGQSYGLDFRINGEFVKGVESWASFSLFNVEENIEGDGYGYLPRPTDNNYSFAIYFQDYLPKYPSFRVSLGLSLIGGFPFGPPQTGPEARIFRAPPYRRVDIGFIKTIKEEGKVAKAKWLNNFKSMWISLEVFNLLESRNTVSYLWIRDVSTANQYAVPNYLTSRLVNLKLRVTL